MLAFRTSNVPQFLLFLCVALAKVKSKVSFSAYVALIDHDFPSNTVKVVCASTSNFGHIVTQVTDL